MLEHQWRDWLNRTGMKRQETRVSFNTKTTTQWRDWLNRTGMKRQETGLSLNAKPSHYGRVVLPHEGNRDDKTQRDSRLLKTAAKICAQRLDTRGTTRLYPKSYNL